MFYQRYSRNGWHHMWDTEADRLVWSCSCIRSIESVARGADEHAFFLHQIRITHMALKKRMHYMLQFNGLIYNGMIYLFIDQCRN